jgi:hypothetical protein
VSGSPDSLPPRTIDEYRLWSEARDRRLLEECDLPIYGLGEQWQGQRSIQIESCGHDGPLSAEELFGRLDVPLTVDLVVAHHDHPDGGQLLVATRRSGGVVDPAVDRELSRQVWVHRFLSFMEPMMASPRSPEVSSDSMLIEAVPFEWRTPPAGAEWRPTELHVDGAKARAQRLAVDDHWLVLGAVPGADISIEGHHFPSSGLELWRVRGPQEWVKGPTPPSLGGEGGRAHNTPLASPTDSGS